MNDDNLLIICRSCGRKQLMHNMRPADDGEHMICVDCDKKGVSIKGETTISKKVAENDAVNTFRNKKEKTEKMIKYICSECKYKFSRKESQHVEKCPYCGKNNVLQDTQLGADKLINESLNKKFEW